MTNNGLPRKAKIMLFLIGVLFLGSIALTLWHIASFHVVSTSLSTKDLSTISPYFDVTFNENIASSGIEVTSAPAVISEKVTVNGRSLTVPFTSTLNSNTTYTITIVSVRSVSGHTLTNQTFTFKPTYIASSNLPSSQQKKILQQESIGKINPNDPIVPHLPYQTTNFTLIENTNPQKNPPKNFPLIATLTLSQADMSDEATAISQYEQQVVGYIQSLGLNPSNYDITYIVQTP